MAITLCIFSGFLEKGHWGDISARTCWYGGSRRQRMLHIFGSGHKSGLFKGLFVGVFQPCEFSLVDHHLLSDWQVVVQNLICVLSKEVVVGGRDCADEQSNLDKGVPHISLF